MIGVLARAFQDDPAMSWVFPDPVARARRLPRLFGIMFDSDAAGMRLLTGGGEAATLWRGPGKVATGVWEIVRHLPALIWAAGPALGRGLRISEAIDAHMPSGDFWYLHMAGCDPTHQGRGHGRAAVMSGLARAAGRLPAYLETATERNLSFYAGLGFRVTNEWHVPAGGPRFWSMLREPDQPSSSDGGRNAAASAMPPAI